MLNFVLIYIKGCNRNFRTCSLENFHRYCNKKSHPLEKNKTKHQQQKNSLTRKDKFNEACHLGLICKIEYWKIFSIRF